MKLNKKDVKILSEGQQLKRIIFEKYDNLNDFVQLNNMTQSVETLKSYFNRKKLPSEKFKSVLVRVFDEDYYNLILPENKQVIRFVDNVWENIREYTGVEDIDTLETIKKLCESKDMEVESIRMEWLIGAYYYGMRKRDEAFKCLNMAMHRAEGYPNLLFSFNSELGLIYYKEGDKEKARRYYSDAEKLLDRLSGVPDVVMFLHYNRYGILNNTTGEHDNAIEMFNRAHLYRNHPYTVGHATMGIGLAYKRKNNYELALEYYDKALTELPENDIGTRCIVYNNIAELYKVLGEYDNANVLIGKIFESWQLLKDETKVIALNTYIQTKLLKDEIEKNNREVMELIDSLCMLDGVSSMIYKDYIVETLSIIIKYAIENSDIEILNYLDNNLSALIQDTSYSQSVTHMNALKACWCDVLNGIRNINGRR